MSNAVNPEADACPLCQRETFLTFHHLIPRKVHRRNRFKKRYSKDDLNRGVYICGLCHKGIHTLFDEMELAQKLNTVKALRQNSRLRRHFAWVSKQKVVS